MGYIQAELEWLYIMFADNQKQHTYGTTSWLFYDVAGSVDIELCLDVVGAWPFGSIFDHVSMFKNILNLSWTPAMKVHIKIHGQTGQTWNPFFCGSAWFWTRLPNKMETFEVNGIQRYIIHSNPQTQSKVGQPTILQFLRKDHGYHMKITWISQEKLHLFWGPRFPSFSLPAPQNRPPCPWSMWLLRLATWMWSACPRFSGWSFWWWFHGNLTIEKGDLVVISEDNTWWLKQKSMVNGWSQNLIK